MGARLSTPVGTDASIKGSETKSGHGQGLDKHLDSQETPGSRLWTFGRSPEQRTLIHAATGDTPSWGGKLQIYPSPESKARLLSETFDSYFSAAELCALDCAAAILRTQVCLAVVFDYEVSADLLQMAVQEVLARYPMLAGRYQSPKGGTGHHVLCCNAGVDFTVASSLLTVEEMRAVVHGRSGFSFDGSRTNALPEYVQVLDVKSWLAGKTPLMAIQLTQLTPSPKDSTNFLGKGAGGGAVVAITVSHMLADGQSMVNIMKDISDSYRSLAASSGLYRRSSSRNSRGVPNPLARCSSAPAALPPLDQLPLCGLKPTNSEVQNRGQPPFGEAVEAERKKVLRWDKAALIKIQESPIDEKEPPSTTLQSALIPIVPTVQSPGWFKATSSMIQAVAALIKELKTLGLSFSDLHNLATVVLYIPQSDIDTLKTEVWKQWSHSIDKSKLTSAHISSNDILSALLWQLMCEIRRRPLVPTLEQQHQQQVLQQQDKQPSSITDSCMRWLRGVPRKSAGTDSEALNPTPPPLATKQLFGIAMDLRRALPTPDLFGNCVTTLTCRSWGNPFESNSPKVLARYGSSSYLPPFSETTSPRALQETVSPRALQAMTPQLYVGVPVTDAVLATKVAAGEEIYEGVVVGYLPGGLDSVSESMNSMAVHVGNKDRRSDGGMTDPGTGDSKTGTRPYVGSPQMSEHAASVWRSCLQNGGGPSVASGGAAGTVVLPGRVASLQVLASAAWQVRSAVSVVHQTPGTGQYALQLANQYVNLPKDRVQTMFGHYIRRYDGFLTSWAGFNFDFDFGNGSCVLCQPLIHPNIPWSALSTPAIGSSSSALSGQLLHITLPTACRSMIMNSTVVKSLIPNAKVL